MKPLKLILLCVIVTLVMIVSWAMGNLVGNIITNSTPPVVSNPSYAGMVFLAVCAFNSILITLVVTTTGAYAGRRKQIALVMFVFTVQILLPQMETFFYGSRMGIGYDQATSILIAGAVMSVTTVMIAMFVHRKFRGSAPAQRPLAIPAFNNKKMLVWMIALSCVVYPFLYLTFGYYVAWQSESLRMYYTQSGAMTTYLQGWSEAFANGAYFLQVIRALIWIVVTVPVVVMLKERSSLQLIVVGLMTSLLPSSLLFIPNPYMPSDVAMVHFVETATSNLIWGLVMVIALRKCEVNTILRKSQG